MRRVLWKFVAIGLLSTTAAAQTPPPVQDWTPETVVVVAHRAGPLFWRVHRGNGEVWILATVGPMPKGLAWNHAGLDQLLNGAQSVLLQPRGEVGLVEGLWFILTRARELKLPHDTHLEDILPEPLKDRFVRMRSKIGRDADRYADFVPAWAGLLLFGDFLKDRKLSADEPIDTVEHLARHKDIPVHTIATYRALPVIDEIAKLPREASLSCLRNVLDDVEAEDIHQSAAANAWAVGDLAGMEQHYSEPTTIACLQQTQSFSVLWVRSVDDTTNAVNAALDKGGKTVMLASLGTLLRKGGILDRLRSEGITVESPQ